MNVTLAPDVAYFTARITAQASTGSIEIRDARMDLASFQADAKAPFGYTLPTSRSVGLDLTQGYQFLQFSGNGSISVNGQTVGINSLGEPSWYPFPQISGQVAQISGNLSISTLLVSRDPLPFQPDSNNVRS